MIRTAGVLSHGGTYAWQSSTNKALVSPHNDPLDAGFFIGRNMEKIREIKLYGSLGNTFGRVHRLAVSSTAEAIRAMCVLLPGFERHLRDSQAKGVAYACFIGSNNIKGDQLAFPCGNDAIRIAPVLQGSKRAGIFQAVLGAALIAAAAFTPGLNAAILPAISSFSWSQLAFSLGASFFLGGVSAMLTKQQTGLATKDGPDNGASYNFNGPVNTTAQGNCRPLLYGRMICGSAVVSAGFYSEDQA